MGDNMDDFTIIPPGGSVGGMGRMECVGRDYGK